MKIFIDRELLLEIDKLLYEYDMMRDATRANTIRLTVERILKDNPEPKIGKCKICGAKTNDRDSWADLNYCGPCWNKGYAEEETPQPENLEIKEDEPEDLTIEQMRKMLTPKPLEPQPDTRCDGCEYQHPFQKILEIDELNNKVLCHRNTGVPYLKDGEWVRGFETGCALMLCSVYKWNNGLIKIKETEKPNATTIFINVLAEDVRKNKRAILEILDMLVDSDCNRGWARTITLRDRVSKLKAELVGEK